MPVTSVPPFVPLVPFKLLRWCWSSEGVSQEVHVQALLRVTAWELNSFFHRLNVCWFLQPEVTDLSIWHWNPGLGGLVWAETPRSQDIPPDFYPPHVAVEPTHSMSLCLFFSSPPTSLDGCSFFNSIVVGFLFNLISDSSEWWLFYILVVILMWLYKKVSHVYLHLHLDQKSPILLLYHLFLSL